MIFFRFFWVVATPQIANYKFFVFFAIVTLKNQCNYEEQIEFFFL